MVKQITPGWYQVTSDTKGTAWFRSMTECIIWLYSSEDYHTKPHNAAHGHSDALTLGQCGSVPYQGVRRP